MQKLQGKTAKWIFQMPESESKSRKKHTILILGKRIPIPATIFMRRVVGTGFVLGGTFSFLPVLGVWMLPVGLILLSHDSHRVRRFRRSSEIYILRKWRNSRFSKNKA
ncbi:hypothetical protein FHS77_002715 [Paenochrobactrum gallinarii]|uniref:Uncharacterized protein n=2 Tax=Paenochrobactrum gallinarii TaxID=643673 RepID=A0A841M071_9HYPH|nr:hypothetical protein [Paenochrobactrum gallinarii]